MQYQAKALLHIKHCAVKVLCSLHLSLAGSAAHCMLHQIIRVLGLTVVAGLQQIPQPDHAVHIS